MQPIHISTFTSLPPSLSSFPPPLLPSLFSLFHSNIFIVYHNELVFQFNGIYNSQGMKIDSGGPRLQRAEIWSI